MISTAHKTNGKTNGRSNGKATRLKGLSELLEHFSRWVTNWSGSSWAFTLALGVVVIWGITGPIFHYSDTWQLVINTGTTIVTFLMVFLIQRSQNKDALAIQIKLNELLASQEGASNSLINLEDWSEDDIIALHQRFAKLTEQLNDAEGECGRHSITEAQDAVNEAHQFLSHVRGRFAREKKESKSPS